MIVTYGFTSFLQDDTEGNEMHQTYLIRFKEKTVMIMPSAEMGGGIDGYYVEALTGQHIAYFSLPYTSSPDQEWRALSNIGKDNVRSKGWSECGNEKHAIAAALKYLDITPGSPELAEFIVIQTEMLADFETQASQEFASLFNRENARKNTKLLTDLLEQYQHNSNLLNVAENLGLYDKGLVNNWAYWPIPKTND